MWQKAHFYLCNEIGHEYYHHHGCSHQHHHHNLHCEDDDHHLHNVDCDDDVDDCIHGDDSIHDQFHYINKNELFATSQSIYRNPLLCLDGSTPPSITTKRCICVQADEMDCGKDDDPSSQWFVLVSSNIHLSSKMVYGGVSKS